MKDEAAIKLGGQSVINSPEMPYGVQVPNLSELRNRARVVLCARGEPVDHARS